MIFEQRLDIGGFILSPESSTFIIAEAGVNHGGDMETARKLVDTAAAAGADAVKFQAFRTEHLILKNVEKAPYQKQTTAGEESQFDMLKKLEMSTRQNRELMDYCANKGIIFLTTPFDEVSLEELDELDLPAYKIASTDLTNLPLLEKVATKRKPIFLSTGMSYLAEVEMALACLEPLNRQVVLLQCSANYPIADADANLKVLETYKKHFNVLLGYSDHSVGIGAAPYAVPLGAKVVEKHFTLSKELEGPDHRASLSPDELKEFVQTIRRVESYMGNGIKAPSMAECLTRNALQKKLVAREPIKKGEIFTLENLVAKRTGGRGISPIYIRQVIGQPAARSFQQNEIIEQ